jgi:hypothetical protein
MNFCSNDGKLTRTEDAVGGKATQQGRPFGFGALVVVVVMDSANARGVLFLM